MNFAGLNFELGHGLAFGPNVSDRDWEGNCL